MGVPLAFIPARLGSFSVGASGQWLALGSNLQEVLMTTDRPVIAVPVADTESDSE